MPVHFTLLESLLARLNLLPVPLFDTPLGPGLGKVLIRACELNLFDTLSERGLTLDALAEQLHCHPQTLQIILQILIAAGYLKEKRGVYRNSFIAQRWLTRGSNQNIAPYIIHSQDIIAIWDHLNDVIATGQPAVNVPYNDATPETASLLARHYAGLASLATVLGREIVYRVHLPAQSKHLLDVGGSHAGYSALFCHKYPEIQATVIDLQPGIMAGKLTAEQLHLEKHIHFIEGDIVQDNFPEQFAHPFDVALYFHIAHLLSAETNQQVLDKVIKTLRPGGMLVFVDQIVDQTHRSCLSSLLIQLMALTMATVGGQCYPFATIKEWLEKAGMVQIRQHHLLTPGATLITAKKR